MKDISHEKRYQLITKVNWICTLVDALLSAIKLSVGGLVNSPALIADGLHSLSDLASDMLALVLGKLAKQGPDDDHPYGHARYETVGTAILGAILLLVAAHLVIENINALIAQQTLIPSWLAFCAAALSVVSKESLFHYTMHYSKLTRSNLLAANAWHSRSDSLSSAVVMISMIFSFAGWPVVEYIAALLVAILIGKMGVKLGWNAIQELIDRGVKSEQQAQYEVELRSIKDIHNVHNIRTRLMGSDVLVDAHIVVNPRISVSEAHQIHDFATARLQQKFKEVCDVILHIDFEDDDTNNATKLEPKRSEILHLINASSLPEASTLYLHYSNNIIEVELVYPTEMWCDSYRKKLDAIEAEHPWIKSISVSLVQNSK